MARMPVPCIGMVTMVPAIGIGISATTLCVFIIKMWRPSCPASWQNIKFGKYFRPEQEDLILLVTDFLIITLSCENRLVKV